TGGIAMGSYWAYYELGWGGWWFWDPVENASFLPWLSGTALLHSAIVMEKRSALKIWTLLLAILTFSLSLLGTFLVRSGVLTSVHAFATDPARGLFILLILAAFIGGSLALFALRAGTLVAGGLFQPISREGALVLNNLFLSTATATVLVGTLYPLLVEAVGGSKISVGAPYFNLTFAMPMVPLMLLMPLGPMLAWKRGDLLAASQRLFAAFAIALIVVALVLAVHGGSSLAPALGAGLGAWVIAGALSDLVLKMGFRSLRRLPPATALRRLAGLPRSIYGTALAHMGVGVTLLGIVFVSAFETESIVAMRPRQTIEVGGDVLRYDGMNPLQGPNFSEQRASFTLLDRAGLPTGTIHSSKRFYPARNMPTTEAGIRTIGFSQLYVSIGDPVGEDAQVVRAWWKPNVTLIWIGALVMMAGGAVSLSDRRLRVGAPARPKGRAAVAEPAE